MLEYIKSNFILIKIVSLLNEKVKLKLIAYNKLLQEKCYIRIIDFKKISNKELIKVKDGFYKIKSSINNLIYYEGGYLNGKKHGKGKEYNKEGYLIFKGEYNNNIKWNGFGTFYDDKGNIKFEGIIKNGKKWTGKGNEYDEYGDLIFIGTFENGLKKNGIGIEYDNKGDLVFIGNYKNGLKVEENDEGIEEIIREHFEDIFIERKVKEKGIEYNYDVLKFEFEHKKGKGQNNNKNIELKSEYSNVNEKNGDIEENPFKSFLFDGKYHSGEKNKGKLIKNKFNKNSVFSEKITNEEEYKIIIINKTKPKINLFCILYLYEDLENLIINECFNEEEEFKKRDKYNKKVKEFDQIGNMIFQGEYINGVKYGKEFDTNGNVVFKGEYSDGERFNGKGKEFYTNGKLKFEGKYIKGKKIGKEFILNSTNGNIILLKGIKIGTFEANKKNINIFRGKEFDNRGNLVFEGDYSFRKRLKGKKKYMIILII